MGSSSSPRTRTRAWSGPSVFQGASWRRCAVHLMRDCMREPARARSEARGAHNVARIPREGRGDRPRHVPRRLRHAARMLPQAADVAEEAEPDALLPGSRLPIGNGCARTTCRANREIERRSRVCAGTVPVREIAGTPGRGRDVRARRAMVESRYFACAKFRSSTTSAARPKAAAEARLRARRSRQEDDNREHRRACGKVEAA